MSTISSFIIQQQKQNLVFNMFDNLFDKFIYHLPEEILKNNIRICFQLRYAFWDYCDTYLKLYDFLPIFKNEKEFFVYCYQNSSYIRSYMKEINLAYFEFVQYEKNIPVYGSILINKNKTKCLLVKHIMNKTVIFSFPKGKIDNNETELNCAIRETFEETGYNISEKINKDLYIEITIKNKLVRLYLIYDVDENYKFTTLTTNEIFGYSWKSIYDLPLNKNYKTIQDSLIKILKPVVKMNTPPKNKDTFYDKFKIRSQYLSVDSF
jgi:mRNA-decapping enzyme subunit 2